MPGLHFGGNFTETGLSGITNSGGTVFIDGTLGNTGSALQTGSGSNLGTVSLDTSGDDVVGTITGGAMLFHSGTLSGVTFFGPVDLSASSGRLHVSNGITLTGTGGIGPGSLLLTGANSRLFFTGTEIIDNASVDIGNNVADIIEETGTAKTLTFGPGLTIGQTGQPAQIGNQVANDTIVNQGVIRPAQRARR